MLKMWCFFAHDVLKRDNKKKQWEKKKWTNERELNDLLWDVNRYFKLLLLKHCSQ